MVRTGCAQLVVGCLVGGGLLVVACTAEPAPDGAAGPRIVQPGAPGEANRELTVEEAAALVAIPDPTVEDVQFVRDMHAHHAQALAMIDLVPGRTASSRLPLLAERMAISQADEMRQMRDWLERHGLPPPPLGGAHAEHEGHLMPGMLTDEELAALAAAEGVAFDRLFLESMIAHHRGAITMVDALLTHGDAARDPELALLATHIVADQQIEISRMLDLLAELPAAPTGSP